MSYYTYYKFVPTPIIKREGRLYTPYLRYESLLYVSVCISLINNDLAYVCMAGKGIHTRYTKRMIKVDDLLVHHWIKCMYKTVYNLSHLPISGFVFEQKFQKTFYRLWVFIYIHKENLMTSTHRNFSSNTNPEIMTDK